MPIDERKELEKIRRELTKLIANEPALRAVVEVNNSLISLLEHINNTTDRLNSIEDEEWLNDIEALEKERREFAPELTPDEARRQFHARMFARILNADFGRVIHDQFILMCGVAIYIYEKKYWPLRNELDRSTTEFKKRYAEHLLKIDELRATGPHWIDRFDDLVERFARYERFVEQKLGEKLSSINSLLDKLYYSVCSSLTYYRIREAFGLKKFELIPEFGWPTLLIDEGDIEGTAQIQPPVAQSDINSKDLPEVAESLAKQMASISDLDADVLDILYLFWQVQTKSENDTAFATVDDLLRIRGLQPKLGGQRRRGGFGPDQRDEIMEAIHRLEHIYVDVEQPVKRVRGSEPQVEAMKGPLITILDIDEKRLRDGKLKVKIIGYKPSSVFTPYLLGAGRQTSLMAARTLKYNLRTEVPEKRLSRYLSWIWKIRSTQRAYEQPFKVG